MRYAPIDFNTQKLEDVLPPLGYDRKQKTFFLLEGVVMYVVEPGNVDELRDALRRVLDDAALRERLVNHGRARAAEFSMERLAQRYLEIYEKALVTASRA